LKVDAEGVPVVWKKMWLVRQFGRGKLRWSDTLELAVLEIHFLMSASAL
jgi:hypothetical protein